jgi:hypothetical protein
MLKIISLLLISVALPALFAGQPPPNAATPPPLLVIDYKACPFEGCKFGKWLVTRNTDIFTTWKEGRTRVAAIPKGIVVTGLDGVHITYEPDRIQVTAAIPDLHLRPGDVILRYMYVGEGFANIWADGQFRKEYDCSFITETDGSGCGRNCSAKVISNGRKVWWVQVKTPRGQTGWTNSDGQFDCMDALGGESACGRLNARQPGN